METAVREVVAEVAGCGTNHLGDLERRIKHVKKALESCR